VRGLVGTVFTGFGVGICVGEAVMGASVGIGVSIGAAVGGGDGGLFITGLVGLIVGFAIPLGSTSQ
jgi:hypothetical protein